MKIKHIYEIAWALLLARSKQTLVAAIGVTFSVAFFISLIGFMEGLNALLDGLVLNRTPHVLLYNDIRPSTIQAIDLHKDYTESHNFVHSIKPANARKEIYNVEAISKSNSRTLTRLRHWPKNMANFSISMRKIFKRPTLNSKQAAVREPLFHLQWELCCSLWRASAFTISST